MKRLIVTGYSSSIAKALFELVRQRQEIEIIQCGRCEKADAIFDFSQVDDCRRFTSFVEKMAPNYLFLNHGLLVGDKLADHSDHDITKALHVNLISVAMMLERLVLFNEMSTVVMSSISGKAGSYDNLYAAAKAGVDLLVKSLAPQLPPNSRLNAISPGIIEDARMTTERIDLNILAEKKIKTPTQMFCSSLEVAKLAYFLLFETGNITGENLNVNGGMYVS